MAASGLSAVTDVLTAGRRPGGIAGGIFIVPLAVRMLRHPPEMAATDRPRRGLAGAYASTFGLTVTNPATILSFAAAFVGLGLLGTGGPGAAALTGGVLSGSAAWWALLALGVLIVLGSATGS